MCANCRRLLAVVATRLHPRSMGSTPREQSRGPLPRRRPLECGGAHLLRRARLHRPASHILGRARRPPALLAMPRVLLHADALPPARLVRGWRHLDRAPAAEPPLRRRLQQAPRPPRPRLRLPYASVSSKTIGTLWLAPYIAEPPDGRGPTRAATALLVRPSAISKCYGHAAVAGVLRGRRAALVLAGGRAARGDPAGGQLAGAVAREAARDAAPRPLRAAGRADRGGACGSTAARSGCSSSRTRSSVSCSEGATGELERHVRDRRVDRARRGRARAAPLPVRRRAPAAARRA